MAWTGLPAGKNYQRSGRRLLEKVEKYVTASATVTGAGPWWSHVSNKFVSVKPLAEATMAR
jgi:hypothetical protein